MRHKILLASSVLFMSLASAPPLSAASSPKATRSWTLMDQVTVPEMRTLALSEDGRSAAYVVRIADLATDKTVAILRSVDLATGATRELLRAAWIEDLRRIPGSSDWSARIDKGEGVQLYRIAPGGAIGSIIFHPATAVNGDTEGAIYPGYAHAPLPTGVRSYSWSPDGRWLWYVVLDAAPFAKDIQTDDAVVAQRARRRTPGKAAASIFLRGPDGQDRLLSKRPHEDISTFFGRSFVEWTETEVRFDVTDPKAKLPIVTMAASLTSNDVRAVEGRGSRGYWRLKGIHGGRLASEGFGTTRELVEIQADDSRKSYGD